jgi:F-type H+-transporting ATPase subunit c
MAKWLQVFVGLVVMALCAAPAMAAGPGVGLASLLAQNEALLSGSMSAVGLGLVVIGVGIGIGRIGGSACEAIARQPEMAGKIQTAMIIAAALIEGAGFFALILCLAV